MGTITKRIQKDGTARHTATVRLKGARPTSRTFARVRDAERWITDTEAQIGRGVFLPTNEAQRRTVAQAIDRYLAEVMPHKPRCAIRQSQQLRWWRDRYGSLFLSRLTPGLLVEAREALRHETSSTRSARSASTVNRYLAAMSHVLTVASREWEWLEQNPLRRVTRFREPRGRERFLTPEEQDRLLTVARASKLECLYLIVMLAISTGMRRNEILGLSWRELDLKAGAATLSRTKNGETRVVPIRGPALQGLKERALARRATSGLVFQGQNPGRPVQFWRHWQVAARAANLPGFRFHDLRHTAASYLALNGATLLDIARILGHRSLQMVQRYAHLTDSHVGDVVERMNRRMIEGKP